MSNTTWQEGFRSSLGHGLQTGYVDVLCLVRSQVMDAVMKGGNYPVDPTVSSIIPVMNFDFDNNQSNESSSRLVGEGAETSTFQAGQSALKASFKLPMLVTPFNWIDQPIAELWSLAKYATWGTPAIVRAKLIDVNGQPIVYNTGTTSIYVDNVFDFLDVPLPFTAVLSPGTAAEQSVSVTAVNKYYRKLTLASATTVSQPVNASIMVLFDSAGGPDFEPAFGLLSLREGFLAPCLVDKLTINAKVGEVVMIDCSVVSGGIWRKEQVDIRNALPGVIGSRTSKIYRAVEGLGIQTSSGSETVPSGQFGLGSALGDRLLSGYEGLEMSWLGVSSSSITIDNSIKEVYTPHSSVTDLKNNQKDNVFPFALISEGRKISGRIEYMAPIEPWAAAERLTASSKINGGLTLDFGCCKIVCPDIIWKPSSSSSQAGDTETRHLDWFLISDDYNDMPDLAYSTRGNS